jgi:subtilase family serine protease
MVFIGSDDHTVGAYSAAGTTNCAGSPKVCTPLWSTSATNAVASSPIVAQGVVYFASLDHKLYADQPWKFTRPNCAVNPNSGLSPCQIQDAYELPSFVTGTGRTVAIVDAYDDPNAEADLAVYRAQYGLPPCTTANGCFQKLNPTGAVGDQGWSTEISLDLDAVSAACPLCHITLSEANTNSFNDLANAEAVAANTHPTAISNSWGGGEFSGENSYDYLFSFAGIPVTFSTGDNGWGTSWPSSSPLVTAVGGTTLQANGSARGWSEAVWGTAAGGTFSGAGSGCSIDTKPAWQQDTGCTNRTIADVSALAGSPGLSIYDTYQEPGWLDYGGTSLASPLVASVYALAYPDSAMSYTYAHTGSLYDITSGTNGPCGSSYLCNGAVGYDGPTGLGTPCGTAAFGTGLFTSSCASPSAGPSAAPLTETPNVIYTPACDAPTPGHASCHADRITSS